MEAMIDEAEYYYGQGVPSGQYNYDEETGEYDYYEKNTLTWFEILITLLVALGIGGAFCGITIGKYRLHFDKYKYYYHKNSHVNLTNRTDRFVNQVVTHRHIRGNLLVEAEAVQAEQQYIPEQDEAPEAEAVNSKSG